MDTILPPPQWPSSFSHFVTWCLMWDPKSRPTSKQALDHEYFADAVDPLRPKSSTTRLLGRKRSDLSFKSKDANEQPTLSTKPSWFRRSLIARDSAPAVPQHDPSVKPMLVPSTYESETAGTSKSRPVVNKRSTWAHGTTPTVGAPMPILPSIRPISPLSNAVTAQASGRVRPGGDVRPAVAPPGEEKAKKIGRQLSLTSRGNPYALSAHREGFFSHLRKRARRFSGRHGVTSPHAEDLEANAAIAPWTNKSPVVGEPNAPDFGSNKDFTDLDKALQSVRYSLEHPVSDGRLLPSIPTQASDMKRDHSVTHATSGPVGEPSSTTTPISSRTRRALQITSHPLHRYETPEEEDELLDEALNSANAASCRLAQSSIAGEEKRQVVITRKEKNHPPGPGIQTTSNGPVSAAYPTPSPSAKRNGVRFGHESTTPSQPVAINRQCPEVEHVDAQWPTPPYEENEWAASAAASIFAAGMAYR